MAEDFPNKLRMIFFEAAPSFRKNKDLTASSLAFSALSHFFHRRRVATAVAFDDVEPATISNKNIDKLMNEYSTLMHS